MENQIKKFDQFVNENLLHRVKKKITGWVEGAGKKILHGVYGKVWKRWEDRIMDYTQEKFKIPSFNYGSDPTIVSEDPVTFEYTLLTYDDKGKRSDRRTFRYTLPKDNYSSIEKGQIEEVTKDGGKW